MLTYMMFEFSFWYGLKMLFEVSRDISKKLHLVVPMSIVILNPSLLKVFIVFFFNLSSSWLLFLFIMASPPSLYNPISLWLYKCLSLLYAYRPIKSQSSAPKNEPIGTSYWLFSFFYPGFFYRK